MRRGWAIIAVLALVGCETPLEPSNVDTDDDQIQTVNVFNFIDISGDHTHGDGGDANSPPVIRNPGTQFYEVGDDVILPIIVTDADDNDVQCALDGAPRNLVIDEATHLITGTISPSSAAESPFVATVRCTDRKVFDAEQFIINVAAPDPEPEV